MTAIDDLRWQQVRDRVAAAESAAGRPAGSVRLLVATKTQPVERIRPVLTAGFDLIGESRVQELTSKAPELADLPHRTHFIGHLQPNKVNQLLGSVDCLETLDSIELATRLQRRLDVIDAVLTVFVQVNVSGESSKSGVEPAGAAELVRACAGLDRLHITGLMTIGANSSDGAQVAAGYRLLGSVAQEIGGGVAELSMGMSGDLEIAIEQGATLVRVGSAMFGPRVA